MTGTAAGWALALWTVCHATALHITSVTFDDRQWSSAASSRGWAVHDSRSGQAAEVVVLLTPVPS
ncbi:hypothetical protein OG762_05760 [Streptomyces sp. NBC_01136]|uniref:hypothetical protein n=1 Tax=unclassified Streptomyces TaxID=2593676 RepID=UPI0032430654|nr:hypothetical protein OG762_05760 [Streptomyces sp. NBC_01136]